MNLMIIQEHGPDFIQALYTGLLNRKVKTYEPHSTCHSRCLKLIGCRLLARIPRKFVVLPNGTYSFLLSVYYLTSTICSLCFYILNGLDLLPHMLVIKRNYVF